VKSQGLISAARPTMQADSGPSGVMCCAWMGAASRRRGMGWGQRQRQRHSCLPAWRLLLDRRAGGLVLQGGGRDGCWASALRCAHVPRPSGGQRREVVGLAGGTPGAPLRVTDHPWQIPTDRIWNISVEWRFTASSLCCRPSTGYRRIS
jgi:hypothetical protein